MSNLIFWSINLKFTKDTSEVYEQTLKKQIPLSKDVTNVDNRLLTKEVTREKIIQTVKQISPMKTLGLD